MSLFEVSKSVSRDELGNKLLSVGVPRYLEAHICAMVLTQNVPLEQAIKRAYEGSSEANRIIKALNS